MTAGVIDRHRDGSGWEELAGYCRAVRAGDQIHVSGTTGASVEGVAVSDDVAVQTAEAIDRALAAVTALGGSRETVLRSRLYLVTGSDWRAAVAVHRERFRLSPPANTTLFVAGLVGEGLLVEVELDALAVATSR